MTATVIRHLLVVWLLFVIVAVSFLAASLPLHQLIHKDAGNDDHHCAITLFAHAQVLALPAGPVFIASVLGIISLVLQPRRILLPARSWQRPPGRAPPGSPPDFLL